MHNLLEPVSLLQIIALALSIFNLVTFLWLACTVWLNGDRRSMIARVGVVGLGLSAFFFYLHGLLISGSLAYTSGLVSQDFLWHLIWLPAIGVPYIWFVIGLHYASLMNESWRRRRPFLLILSAFLGVSVLTLLILNRSTFTFAGTLRLLIASNFIDNRNVSLLSPLIMLPVLFLLYVAFCAIGPWFTPHKVLRVLRVFLHAPFRGKRNTSLRRDLNDAFWNDQRRVELLEEPILSWHLARPGLLLAALLMVCLTVILGTLGIWSMVSWLKLRNGLPGVVPAEPLTAIPFNLMLLDIFTVGSVAFIILLIGYSIVRHGILIERPLARRGFFEQWRGIVIVATTSAIFIALLVFFTRSNLGGLLLITSLATGIYALFTWSGYTAHDRYIAMLGPFLRSTNVRHWLNTDLQKTEQSMEDLFFHLCKDVLEVRCARLVVMTGSVRRSFNYRFSALGALDKLETPEQNIMNGANLDAKQLAEYHPYSNQAGAAGVNAYRTHITVEGVPTIFWVLPIYDEFGPVARLYLGPRQDGGIFTDEDMDLAHACGQRILDTLRDHEAMLAVAGLLRRRIVDVKLLGAQQRRVLHDEILPQMHLALLRLETLRPVITDHQRQPAQALDDTIEIISDAHRRLAAMMRTTTTGAPHRLERDGMMHAIHTMMNHDFQQAFDEIEWMVSEETARHIDELVPPAVAELIFAAVQEALRNAARHARGSDVHRRLHVMVKATCNPHLEIIVADDGVGIGAAISATTGTGGGLLTHSALLAIAGGSLTVKSVPGEGATVRIFLPAESLC
ncbi:MAG TPA: ATP-binding protein [Ktedonosporobacter sp.]|jgi:signal transduction histidine kinase|nr:ATP-binding protein [Ktedonosporobacter sp.]